MALFIVHNLKKKYLELIQTYDDASFMGPKCPNWPKQEFILKIFVYLFVHFIIQNFQKILRADPKLWGCIIFGIKTTHCPKQKKIFRKSSRIFFDLPIVKYERKLLDPISRKLKTCEIHLPQTNGQRDRLKFRKGKTFWKFYIFISLLSTGTLSSYIKFKQKVKWISR